LRPSKRDAPAGGEYKVYKNTLVRIAAKSSSESTSTTCSSARPPSRFISTKSDGTPGDIASVAKAVQDFAKGQPLLVLKGGVLGEKVLDA
jgi:large subunit ribosomal protein L10